MYLPTLSIENGKATIYVIDTYDGEIVFEVREPREEITWGIIYEFASNLHRTS